MGIKERILSMMRLSKGDGGGSAVVRKRDRKLVVELMRQTESLTRSDLSHWRMAHQMAIDVENPTRVQLLRIYRDVELDGHLSGAVEQIRGKVKARSFKLVNAGDEADDQAVKMLDTDWFKQVVDLWLDTRYWGFSLVQCGEPYTDSDGVWRLGYVALTPREHVCPEHGRVVRIAGEHWSAGFEWRKSEYAPYLLEMGRPDDLGLYLKCARYTISKKNVEQFWDTFAEIFGMPLRIARTSSREEGDRRKLMAMMEQMGSAAYAVVQEGTEVDVVENSKSDAFEVYDRRIERCDRELSKLVIGQTMTIEDGSSLSQSETHLDVLMNIVEDLADGLRDFVNGQVLPLMLRCGAPVDGLRFEWDYPLDYTPEQMTAVETMLLQHFDVDGKYFEDKYGVPVTGRKGDVAQEPQPAGKESLSKSEMERFFGYAPLAPGGEEVTLGKDDGLFDGLRGKFRGMMKAVFEQGGSELKVSVLGDERVQSFIDAHSQVLDSSFDEVDMSDRMRQRLQRSDWVFSGMKAFKEMGEAFPSLVDANGVRKPFEQFLRDVQKIDDTYNKHYLKAEYEFAAASADMAAKWERFMEDGDRYNLQYRTAGDDRVRPEHAALNGVTLPPTDEFWESYYPPNGWRCRCTVVQVRKKKHPETPHDEAMALGEAALGSDIKGMFRFNPGKQERVFPAYNAYTQEKCRGCNIDNEIESLAFIPNNKRCAACKLLRKCYEGKTKRSEYERIEKNRKLYDRLSKDKRYYDVQFNPETGALKATHVGHKTGSSIGHLLEKKLLDLLFACGHSIILCDERKKGRNGDELASLDMILDGVRMDIKSILENKEYYGWPLYRKNDQLIRFNSRTDIHETADTLCVYFDDPSMFAPEKITKGYEFLQGKTNDIQLFHIVCMINSNKGLEIKQFDFQ